MENPSFLLVSELERSWSISGRGQQEDSKGNMENPCAYSGTLMLVNFIVHAFTIGPSKVELNILETLHFYTKKLEALERLSTMKSMKNMAWNEYVHDQLLAIVDPTLEGQYPTEQALRVMTIALLCTQGSWPLRPAMSEVVLMLTNNSEITVQPTQPAFIDAAAARPANCTPTPESAASAAAPSIQGSHGSISVSLLPR